MLGELARKRNRDLAISAVLSVGRIGGNAAEECLRQLLAEQGLDTETTSAVRSALQTIMDAKDPTRKPPARDDSPTILEIER
jgi:hypothetical protein